MIAGNSICSSTKNARELIKNKLNFHFFHTVHFFLYALLYMEVLLNGKRNKSLKKTKNVKRPEI